MESVMINNFSMARLPRIEFGRGTVNLIPDLLKQYGRNVLLITGGQSFIESDHGRHLLEQLKKEQFSWEHQRITGEPSPTIIDELVVAYKSVAFDVVLGIGGGSVIDAAKAVAGLLRVKKSVMDYLEGVGPEHAYSGPAVPFIAVPTTAGTGSEATKNAVLSLQGKQGFKKSFRDEMLVPQYAVVDPQLLASCSSELIAANGMDALTQLLESYVSSKANPVTDALALSGIQAVSESLLDWYAGGEKATQAQDKMAYAAMISGITLAQVGLGSVHGLAAPLGAFFPISHGIVCGTLVAQATQMNIQSLRQREPQNRSLDKYAEAGKILNKQYDISSSAAGDALVSLLWQWTDQLQLPRLSTFGIKKQDIDHIVANSRGSSMKTNPIELADAEIAAILMGRL